MLSAKAGGSKKSKSYGLGTGWISPEHTPRCRWRRFPFQHSGAALPSTLPDCHLVRTAILFLPGEDSLGDFHHSPTASLASFAKRVSPGNHSAALAGAAECRSLIHPPHVKAGYVRAQRYAPRKRRCTASRVPNLLRTRAGNTTMGVRPRTRTGLHGNRVGLTMPLESALSPQAHEMRFPPAPTQNWAYQAGTTGFIDVPFRGFLGPPSETADLTRILRRRLAEHSIAHLL